METPKKALNPQVKAHEKKRFTPPTLNSKRPEISVSYSENKDPLIPEKLFTLAL